jgi:hypothetical protein
LRILIYSRRIRWSLRISDIYLTDSCELRWTGSGAESGQFYSSVCVITKMQCYNTNTQFYLNETRESLQITNENSHRRNLGGGGGKIGGQIPPPYFFYVRIIVLSTLLKRGKNLE